MQPTPHTQLAGNNLSLPTKIVAVTIFVVYLLLLGAGCGSSKMVIPKVTTRVPVNVSSFNLPKINFATIRSSLLPGQIIGSHYDGSAHIKFFDYQSEGTVNPEWEERYKRIILEEFSNAGYSAAKQPGLFEESDSFDARLLIGGTITSTNILTFGRLAGDYSEMFLEIEWEVFDKEVRKTVFKSKTGGYAKTNGLSPESSLYAFRSSVRNLLADSNLVETLQSIPYSTSSGDSTNAVEFHNNYNELAKATNKLAEASKAVFAIKTERGIGSGFIINADGYALASYHVVENRSSFDAIFNDGKTIRLSVVKVVPEKDLALLKLSGIGYPYLPFIEQTELELGHEVYVIGTPLAIGLSQTISKGIVSGMRKIDALTLIQTDASINPGNSGGPLTNAQGKVVGIVSLKLAGPGLEGLGFAISIEDVKKALQLKSAQK